MRKFFVVHMGEPAEGVLVADVEAPSHADAAQTAIERRRLNDGDIVYVVERKHVASFIGRVPGPVRLEASETP